MILSLVEQFLNDAKVVANLAGRLVIVEPGRIDAAHQSERKHANDSSRGRVESGVGSSN